MNPPKDRADLIARMRAIMKRRGEIQKAIEAFEATFKAERDLLNEEDGFLRRHCTHKHSDGSSARWSDYYGEGCNICD